MFHIPTRQILIPKTITLRGETVIMAVILLSTFGATNWLFVYLWPPSHNKEYYIILCPTIYPRYRMIHVPGKFPNSKWSCKKRRILFCDGGITCPYFLWSDFFPLQSDTMATQVLLKAKKRLNAVTTKHINMNAPAKLRYKFRVFLVLLSHLYGKMELLLWINRCPLRW